MANVAAPLLDQIKTASARAEAREDAVVRVCGRASPMGCAISCNSWIRLRCRVRELQSNVRARTCGILMHQAMPRPRTILDGEFLHRSSAMGTVCAPVQRSARRPGGRDLARRAVPVRSPHGSIPPKLRKESWHELWTGMQQICFGTHPRKPACLRQSGNYRSDGWQTLHTRGHIFPRIRRLSRRRRRAERQPD